MRTALAILLCSVSLLTGQETPQPLPEVFQDAEQAWNLRWWGISGRSYFIEASDDMQNWSFAPIIEPGNDEEIVWETGALSQRQFIRLTYTDQTAPDLDAADFDGDGLGNLLEISVHNTHPLRSDTDSDGLADAWEIANDLDPRDGAYNSVNGGNGDPDGDGSTNLDEQDAGTNPKTNQDFPVQLISISRSGSGDTVTPPNGGGIPGTLTLSNSWNDDQSEENLSQELVPSFLASRLSSQMAFPATPPEEEGAATISNLVNGNVSADGRFSVYTDNGITNAGGSLSQAKVWLKSPASPNPREFKLLKLTRELATPLNPSGGTAGQETASYSSIDVETFTIPANEELSAGVELLPVVESATGSRKRMIVSLKEMGIKPAEGMAGVVGDMIPSNQVVNPQLHFVSPKKTDEIPNDYVIFEATGIDEKQIKNGDPAQVVTWVGGEEVPDVPLKRRVKRDQAAKTELMITTLPQHGSEEVVKVNVWVVWSASEISGTIPAALTYTQHPQIGIVTNIKGGLQHKHSIQPEAILTSDERPELSGVKTSEPPGDNHPLFVSEPLKNGATKKWDASRRLRFKYSNPNGLPSDAFSQPAPLVNVASFPLNPVEGNDDVDEVDEVTITSPANNPYLPQSENALWSTDSVEFAISKGNVGDVYIFNIQLQEFSRINMLGKWYRVSEYMPWRMKVNLKKVAHPQGDHWELDATLGAQAFVLQNNNDDF